MQKISRFYQFLLARSSTAKKKAKILARPVFQKYGLKIGLAIIFVFVILLIAARLTQSEPQAEPLVSVKPLSVEVMKLDGTLPNLKNTAEVQNLGVVTLVAQTAGPIKSLPVSEGSKVKVGAQIASQETGYGTGNAAAIGAQIAQKNLEIAEKSYSNTQESVRISRELAGKNRDNTEELRKISEQSLGGTRKLLDTTKLVIAKIESDIAASTDPSTIQGLRQQLINFQSILNGTETQLKNLEYSTNTNTPPNQIANLSKDQVFNSTQLQLDTAQLSKDIAQLSLKSARLTASLATVRAPFAGTIERVFVTTGQYLTPGTPVAKLSGKPRLCLVVTISGQTAQRIANPGFISLSINQIPYSLPITHLSSTPTAGNLFEVLAVLPENMSNLVYEGQSLDVEIQTSQAKTIRFNGSSYLVPLESVFVSSLERYVFLAKDGVAIRTMVKTGEIFGSDIEITEGLQSGDLLILDRRVIDRQPVQTQFADEKIEERG